MNARAALAGSRLGTNSAFDGARGGAPVAAGVGRSGETGGRGRFDRFASAGFVGSGGGVVTGGTGASRGGGAVTVNVTSIAFNRAIAGLLGTVLSVDSTTT
ncbi:MAG: hypothetical protein JRE45_19770 [Deltaproteobacteria bacterium]|nr:hypothetical protein [Deltaproteobacteria bacterium]